jgi:hypothetical protein
MKKIVTWASARPWCAAATTSQAAVTRRWMPLRPSSMARRWPEQSQPVLQHQVLGGSKAERTAPTVPSPTATASLVSTRCRSVMNGRNVPSHSGSCARHPGPSLAKTRRLQWIPIPRTHRPVFAAWGARLPPATTRAARWTCGLTAFAWSRSSQVGRSWADALSSCDIVSDEFGPRAASHPARCG